MRHVRRLDSRLLLAAALAIAPALAGCIQDPDCGVCDPASLDLDLIAAPNYTGAKIYRVSPPCEGSACPPPASHAQYFVTEVSDCLSSDEALASPSAEEFCRVSPLIGTQGIELIFNNLLDPESVERSRRDPDNPQLYEIYAWNADLARMHGPMARYRGDYVVGSAGEPDVVRSLVNLSCVDAIPGFDEAMLDDPATNPCNRWIGGRPAKMEVDAEFFAAPGLTSPFSGSCVPPNQGVDTCCSTCEWLLSTRVARYGLTIPHVTPTTIASIAEREAPPWPAEVERNPNLGTALTCELGAAGGVVDRFRQCEGFQPGIDRRDEQLRYEYRWNCPATMSDADLRARQDPCFVHRMPFYDRLREVHPDARPTPEDVQAGLFSQAEDRSQPCASTLECTGALDLPGTECIGTHADGRACLAGASIYAEGGAEAGACEEGRCRPEWFVACSSSPDTTGSATGYCVDRRFDPRTIACFDGAVPFPVPLSCDHTVDPSCPVAPPGTTIAYLDGNENGSLSATEACAPVLGGPATCDPFLQTHVVRSPRFDRDVALPSGTRDCICEPLETLANESCRVPVQEGCYEGEEYLIERHGQYAVRYIRQAGGVIYDPAVKGVLWIPATTGQVPRAAIEQCAEGSASGLIAGRSRLDAWLAHATTFPRALDDFDRALCSGQEYRIDFAGPDAPAHVRDKAGNTLAHKAQYRFQTPQFHVVPASGSPDDTLRIGACESFGLSFSNKYDLSPDNLRKLQLLRLDPPTAQPIPPREGCSQITPVAGGPACIETQEELTELREAGDLCASPCLTVNVANHATGAVRVALDTSRFTDRLTEGQRYRLLAPAAATLADAVASPEAYAAVFWDACGMPLVLEHAIPYSYDFTIDPAKCSDDPDRDRVSSSCDNAREVFNPLQQDADLDGVADVIDICPVTPSSLRNNADSDTDGIGNECDSCPRPTDFYNIVNLPPALAVRNNPSQQDTDRDGIGDACDNCVTVANCGDWNASNPHPLGTTLPDDDARRCQTDEDRNMIGDACEGLEGDGAAGPVGFGPTDDFDQDGLPNAVDGCPRHPLPSRDVCSPETPCSGPRSCSAAGDDGEGICNHADADDDGVGDLCDSCPRVPNAGQVTEGLADDDDRDGDFVGAACETSVTLACADSRPDPRRLGFFPVAVNGSCCTLSLLANEAGDLLWADDLAQGLPPRRLTAPHPTDPTRTLPVWTECTPSDQTAERCAPLPGTVASRPGILTVPDGCEEALATWDGRPEGAEDFVTLALANMAAGNQPEDAPDVATYWSSLCFLPQPDQDFDGVNDDCDLCEFNFDPENTPYRDDTGRVFEDRGKFCSGAYSLNAICDDPDMTGGDTDGGLDTDAPPDTDGLPYTDGGM